VNAPELLHDRRDRCVVCETRRQARARAQIIRARRAAWFWVIFAILALASANALVEFIAGR
jgi:hypothetical protein